jgi:hypothetical protein
MHVMLSRDLLAYSVSGGPSDHRKGIVCSFGYGATYQVVRRGSQSISILQNVDSLNGRIHKPSQFCYEHYAAIGIIFPPQIGLAPSADGSAMTVNDRVRFTRTPARSPKVWSAGELNSFIDYYRGLMRIY